MQQTTKQTTLGDLMKDKYWINKNEEGQVGIYGMTDNDLGPLLFPDADTALFDGERLEYKQVEQIDFIAAVGIAESLGYKHLWINEPATADGKVAFKCVPLP